MDWLTIGRTVVIGLALLALLAAAVAGIVLLVDALGSGASVFSTVTDAESPTGFLTWREILTFALALGNESAVNLPLIGAVVLGVPAAFGVVLALRFFITVVKGS